MSSQCFDLTIDNSIAHIILNRPEKRNAMSTAFWNDLPDIIRDVDRQSKARVIVISSTGPHFTAGLDLSEFTIFNNNEQVDEQTRKTQEASLFYENVKLMQDSFTAIEQCRIPVLAAIQGGCIGGGVDLVTACDMRYMTKDAFFTIYEIKIGMTADVGTFPRIVKLLPEGMVRELAYTGRRMLADESLRLGFVNQVFADQNALLDGVMAIANEIALNAPLAVHGCKRMITYARDHSTADGLDYVAVWNMSMLKREEMKEAILANQEKRVGNFVELPTLETKL